MRLYSEQSPDRVQSCVFVVLGIFREVFRGGQRTIRRTRDNVCECPASVYPEFPLSRRHSLTCLFMLRAAEPGVLAQPLAIGNGRQVRLEARTALDPVFVFA